MRALHKSLAGAQARPGWARLGYPFPSPRGKARVVDYYFYYYYLSPALFPTIILKEKLSSCLSYWIREMLELQHFGSQLL